ncbi:MAG: hypothetical protein OSB47_12695, partial [Pirellulaceae bacterium]|nr:hypothetical protein [Pirellulaceae bacterium]
STALIFARWGGACKSFGRRPRGPTIRARASLHQSLHQLLTIPVNQCHFLTIARLLGKLG